MTGETSGPSAQDIRMASFEEKFNDLLNFVRLLVKRDTESEKQVEDIDKGTSEDNTGGHSHTNLGPPPVQPSKPKEGDFQLDVKVKKTIGSTKMVDASALLAIAKPDVENEARTVNPNVHGSEEFEKEAQSPISKKEEPKEVDRRMTPHKRHTPKDVVERVEQLEKQLDEVVQSMHQLITLTGTLLKDDRKAIRDLASHSTIGQASTKSLSKRGNRKTPKARNSHASHWAIPIQPKSFFLRKTKVRAEKIFPHLLHDSSKKCEFHFGRPGHSLEDCHALKNKVQDLVDHGILRINEGSTPSVIIAWPPERRKDETVIPSPQSQGPTTCGIQPVHLTTLPTLSEVGEHTVPKTQPKLMSNFRNLDDQCSSDKEKAEYRASRCMTLKRKIQGLGHSEPDVPFMVQARKPSMHTVPMKKARSTLGFGANGPSRDQTERTIPRSTGAWIPHRQG
uniref:Retrotransposon gag domain-containing protein n=1 Tax=Fagus sylvatica TaxID=28930 RepID=A0A2N9I4H3_FAGSY